MTARGPDVKLAILMSQAPRPCVEARSVHEGLCSANPKTATCGNPLTSDVQLVPASGAVKHADVGGYRQRAGRVRIDHEEIDRDVWQITTDIAPSGAAVRGFLPSGRPRSPWDGRGTEPPEDPRIPKIEFSCWTHDDLV